MATPPPLEPAPEPTPIPAPAAAAEPWPPEWARSSAFLTGIGLTVWEAVVEHSQHLFVYGVAFLLTGLPIARGVEKLLDLLPRKA